MSEETRPTGPRLNHTAADADITKINGQYPRAVFVGTAGTVAIMDALGNVSSWVVPAGVYIYGSIRQVMSTGTSSASDFVLCY
jgi:hypothetical protein